MPATRLSVQVHPDDAYAASHGLDAGKTEMWYVLEAEPGATLVNGLKPGVTPEEIKDAALIGACEPLLNTVKVKKGDCFYIPAGLVHAIGKGILLAEIQQNSNTTYRLYDYDRVGTDGKKRELHTDKAAEVIKTSFNLTGVTVNKTLSRQRRNYGKSLMLFPVLFGRIAHRRIRKNRLPVWRQNASHTLCTRRRTAGVWRLPLPHRQGRFLFGSRCAWRRKDGCLSRNRAYSLPRRITAFFG